LLNNEQVQNIEKSKASIVVVVSCFATAQARIQVRQSEIYISSQVKLALKKTQRRQGSWLWFIHVRCICIVQVLCSCVTHLAKWTTLFAEFKCFD